MSLRTSSYVFTSLSYHLITSRGPFARDKGTDLAREGLRHLSQFNTNHRARRGRTSLGFRLGGQILCDLLQLEEPSLAVG